MSLKQFGLIVWKNWLLQKRKKVLTAFEIGVPILFGVVLVAIRPLVSMEQVDTLTTWDAFEIKDGLPSTIPDHPSGDPWALAFSPNTSVIQEVMRIAGSRLHMKTEGYGFDSEDDMVNGIINQTVTNRDILMGIVFDPTVQEEFPKDIHYKIRPRSEQFNSDTGLNIRFFSASDWKTSYIYPFFPPMGPREPKLIDGGEPGYYREGFLNVQKALDLAITEYLNGSLEEHITVEMKRHPHPPYLNDFFITVLQYQLGFIILLSFVVVAPNIVKDVCLEKEKKLKESMKLMGLNNWMHWSAWFLKYLIFCTISVAGLTLLLHVNFGSGAIINATHFTITFLFLWLFAIATIMFCFMVSTFFSKASAGAAAGGILYLITYVPYFFFIMELRDMTTAVRVGTSFISNLAMAWGCVEIANLESTGAGLQWSNIATPANADYTFTMMHCLVILAADSVIYGLLTWYFDAVLPGDYGIPLPWYFPFTKSYWCGYDITEAEDKSDEALDYKKVPGINSEYFEDAPQGIPPGIKIRNLRKEYKKSGTKKVAVENLCLDMYEGQITSLLGHNGAGKTTTMFIMTGFLRPTSGTAFINGHDIKVDIKSVRSSLGLCPQHDILFDTLTVHEHLTFFAKLKGCPDEKVDQEVDDMIGILRLTDKRDVYACNLSGGMKRKLSVGIALIAGSKIVILDEPTSGMDPEARRQTWEILQSQRAGRTMILSTHFMDEADLLGDRIAIMAEGVVQCYGSSFFLKSKYGAGYHMVMVKQPGCQSRKITEVVTRFAPEAKLESNVSAELSYVLPSESSHVFEDLFTYLEENSKELKISSFGASVTTMEEVFLQVGERVDESLEEYLQAGTQSIEAGSRARKTSQAFTNKGYLPDETPTEVTLSKFSYKKSDSLPLPETELNGMMHQHFINSVTPEAKEEASKTDQGIVNGHVDEPPSLQRTFSIEDDLPPVFGHEIPRNTGFKLQVQQFRAMLVKKMLHSKRNLLVTIVQLLVPTIFATLGCAVLEIFPGPRDPPSAELSLNAWDNPVTNFLINGSGTDLADLGQYYADFAQKVSSVIDIESEDYDNMDLYLGAIGAENVDVFTKQYMVASTWSQQEAELKKATAHFNNQAMHTTAISLNLVMNAILKYIAGEEYSIYAENHPLPRATDTAIQEELDSNITMGFIISWNVSFGMAFLISTFVVFIIKERITKSKHVQFVSGVHVFNFWISTFLWDFINFLIPSLLLLIIFVAFDVRAYISDNNIGCVFLLFVLYAWSVLPFVYLLSFIFSVASSGYVWITVLAILTGTAAVLIVVILGAPELGTEDVAVALEWLFYAVLPNFCFGNALDALYANMETMLVCNQIDELMDRDIFCRGLSLINMTNPCCPENCGYRCSEWQENVLAWESPGIGRAVVFMGIQGVVFFAILFFIESGFAQKWSQKIMASSNEADLPSDLEMGLDSASPEDSDVLAEAERVKQTPFQDLVQADSLVLKEIRKFYGQFLAVDNVSVGIPQGECFGLLGVNGAGKTTIFKMLTGDESLSSGNAYLGGFSVVDSMKTVRQLIGYCPQFDALIDQMTVRETLWMFARLRGLKEEEIEDAIETLIQSLLLQNHANKQAGQLSGGNKRKLSTAIALIGDPPVIFLDEPTTGMDPMARRLLWDTLTKVRKSGRTLVLTSHSMEECEALCTRLAIMVNGKFQCLGSPQHLKNKFGEGYTLIAKVSIEGLIGAEGIAITENKVNKLKTFIENQFPGSELKDSHTCMVHYQVPTEGVSWANIFGTMERAKKVYDIEDYSVSQTSLEQVFLSFARAQMPPREEGVSCTKKCGKCCQFFLCCKCCSS